MFLLIFQSLDEVVRGLGVFGYITHRAVLASLTALFIDLFLWPRVILGPTPLKIYQSDR